MLVQWAEVGCNTLLLFKSDVHVLLLAKNHTAALSHQQSKLIQTLVRHFGLGLHELPLEKWMEHYSTYQLNAVNFYATVGTQLGCLRCSLEQSAHLWIGSESWIIVFEFTNNLNFLEWVVVSWKLGQDHYSLTMLYYSRR